MRETYSFTPSVYCVTGKFDVHILSELRSPEIFLSIRNLIVTHRQLTNTEVIICILKGSTDTSRKRSNPMRIVIVCGYIVKILQTVQPASTVDAPISWLVLCIISHRTTSGTPIYTLCYTTKLEREFGE